MKELKPANYHVREEMEPMTYSSLDFDFLLEILEADFDNSPPPDENPVEDGFDPLQPPTEGDMPHGAAPFGLQQPALPAPGFLDALNDFPPLPPNYAPAEEGYHPQQPPTEGDMPHGAAPLGLQQPVLPAPGFLDALNDFPPVPPNYAPAEEGYHPQQPPKEGDMPQGAAPFGMQQQVLPAPGFNVAPTDFPLRPPCYAAAADGYQPQQPHTHGAMPYGAAPFGLQQQVLPAPGPAPPMYQPPTALQPSYMQPAAPCRRRQVNNVPANLPRGWEKNLTAVGYINGQIVYGLPNYTAPPVASDVPVVKAHAPRKRKFYAEPDESKPYVKKPPNAFMIYRTEQRPTVAAELQNRDCAAINKVIGQMWRSLPKEEQAIYYGHADRERQLHTQMFPEWSACDNYGIKRKRIRRKDPMTDYSAI
ncbi:unnamed protein product [Pleuronectes platessa]|uniref:HMG box domain-containing protein n=1 Tax=Pleuronectes platessa TaxID=8262 RepID=A0A9N7YNW0_PLEPL|nr:unnamed protein product [Pleuronectes platessa]